MITLTDEQQQIISTSGDLKVNAVAGSGKTSTMIAYAASLPASTRILYLAFNRSVKMEAAERFKSERLKNVRVETAHSLAYRRVVHYHGYKVRTTGYKSHELVPLLGIRAGSEPLLEYILANHIMRLVAMFCNSTANEVNELDYLSTIADEQSRTFASQHRGTIYQLARIFLAKMNAGDIEITHDFYLKKFQLSRPQLPFDVILFDEGQDASAVMLDIFMQQSCTKVIVGDTHQQIYAWRFAVNSLQKTSFPTLHLSRSFRFGTEVASLAKHVLGWKKHIQKETEVLVEGVANHDNQAVSSRATIARTNLGLLLRAIDFIEKHPRKKLWFEGNVHSYTYADEGASLYDILNLYNEEFRRIRDPLIKNMKSLEDLEEYIDKTGDVQLSMMLEIVTEYGNRIPGLIRQLKDQQVTPDDRDTADRIFSTVHRCKGMEYDDVYLVNDFMTEERLLDTIEEYGETNIDRERLNEEINLVYVAVTRARKKLRVPAEFLPEGFKGGDVIVPYGKPREGIDINMKGIPEHRAKARDEKTSDPSDWLTEKRRKHPGAYRKWTDEQDLDLTLKFCEGWPVDQLARHFERTPGAIRSRIQKLELQELYGISLS